MKGRKDGPYIMERSRGPSRHLDPIHRLNSVKRMQWYNSNAKDRLGLPVERRKWAYSGPVYKVDGRVCKT